MKILEKVDAIKLIGIAGTVLGIASTLISGYASEQNLNKIVNEKVEEAMKMKNCK